MIPAILVVSARPDLRRAISDSLAGADTQIVTAVSEDEALRAAGSFDVALAVLDGTRPGSAAHATARRLRALERARLAPVLLIAPPGDPPAWTRDPDLGIAEVLGEPIDPVAFAARARPYLELGRSALTIHDQSALIRELRRQELARRVERERELSALVEQAGPEPRPEPLGLNEVVRHVLDGQRAMLPAGIRLEERLSSMALPVRIDRRRLERVVHCLIDNACDAMPCGGRLTVETSLEELQPDHRCTLARGLAPARCISVEDTGTGMDALARSHLFEPFFTTKGPLAGVGLNLFIANRFVAQSGGVIEASSTPGCGSRFAVYLPRPDARLRAGDPAPAAVAPPDPVPREDARGTVLVVEDDDQLRGMVALILEAGNYRVITAGDAEEATQMVDGRLGGIDLLIADIALPGVSGVVLADRLRTRNPDLKVLHITAHPEVVDSRRASVTSHLPYLRKPFAVDEMLSAVEHALAG